MSTLNTIHTLRATKHERLMAAKLSETLNGLQPQRATAEELASLIKTSGDTLSSMLLQVLSATSQQLAQGNDVVVLGLEQELTTQEAANLLGLSRQHVASLLDSGEMVHRKIGKHRRVKLKEVLDFQQEIERGKKVAAELVKEAQELEMGY